MDETIPGTRPLNGRIAAGEVAPIRPRCHGLTPLVSAVIPVKDRRELVVRAIRSVLNQTYPQIEVIVVDDGSTDGTGEHVRAMFGDDVRLIQMNRSRGGGAARNAGIDNARGDYIAFLDSDDEWTEEKLTTQMSTVLPLGLDSVLVSYGRIAVRRGSSVRDRVVPSQLLNGRPVDLGEYLFAESGLIQTSTILVPTKVARSVRFAEELPRHQDYDFVLRAALADAVFVGEERTLAVWHADERSDRISNQSDPQPSISWLMRNRGLLSRRARAGFAARIIWPRLSRRQQLIQLLPVFGKALALRALSIRTTTGILVDSCAGLRRVVRYVHPDLGQ